ncbi:hypothetical protein BRARA_A01305 [Brassica rapa]|uniref:Uncharacterized protein n=2 Tax=Brassica campestris TaxID=3711 RepID=A0A398ATA2_BRACM|nr:uncharacterized protein LOC103860614 [Brassica rapa]RID78476.1 hypothetical protein BRARA_A01305 [Brassica rapa]CAG7887353.1 unnamed protein product [Brassica rapa]VDC74867.1 unnamed protein product [Brassica rapa]
MRSESETLVDQPKPLTLEEMKQRKADLITCFVACYFVLLICCFLILLSMLVPQIKIVHMSFTTELNNNSTTQQVHYLPLVSARWDLLIRVPGKLVGDYICLQGNLQASFLYKNVTLVTSSVQSYGKLEVGVPQLLNISAVATEEDLGGAAGMGEIMEAIKERTELRFGSRLSLTDCREETEEGALSYDCEDTMLKFEQGSNHIKATTFGKHASCIVNL